MAMTLQEAIDSAIAHANFEYGTITVITVSMHDEPERLMVGEPHGPLLGHESGDVEHLAPVDSAAVLGGGQVFETYGPGNPPGKPTFHPDLPLRDWGPARVDTGLASVSGRWFNRPVPGFSTRGQGGITLNVAAGGGASIPIDVSVRRDPGVVRFLSFPGLGPSVQMEIEKLSGPGGTATSGVTLNATEDGTLVRAVGPSVRDPAMNASYTVTIVCVGRPG